MWWSRLTAKEIWLSFLVLFILFNRFLRSSKETNGNKVRQLFQFFSRAWKQYLLNNTPSWHITYTRLIRGLLTILKTKFCFITVSKGSNISALLQSHGHVVRSKQVATCIFIKACDAWVAFIIKLSSCFDQTTWLWLWVETKYYSYFERLGNISPFPLVQC